MVGFCQELVLNRNMHVCLLVCSEKYMITDSLILHMQCYSESVTLCYDVLLRTLTSSNPQIIGTIPAALSITHILFFLHKVCMIVMFVIRCRACVMESSHFSDEKTILFKDSLQEWSEEGRVHQAASLPVAQHSSKGEPTDLLLCKQFCHCDNYIAFLGR